MGDGVITFHNVFVSRRPGQGKTKVSKGSSMSAAAAAAAERQAEFGGGREEEEEDTNYTQFDVTIDTVNVTLSFVKWWNGKGLLRDVEVKGVRGVVDRTSVHWSGEYVDPRTFRHEHNPGILRSTPLGWKISWSLFISQMTLGHFRSASSHVNYRSCGSSGSFTISSLQITCLEHLMVLSSQFIHVKCMGLRISSST